METSHKARILLYDIETIGFLGWSFGPVWDANILHVEHYPHLLTVAWKWLDEKKINVLGLDDFSGYSKNKCNDRPLVEKIHELYSEADIVIAHNGNKFDQKMVNARFFHYKMSPPAPYRQLDTRNLAKKYARFESNKLDDISDFMGHGRKVKHGDFEDFWLKAHAGDRVTLKKMKYYNKIDVRRLEEWYLDIRPWIDNHPSISLLEDRPNACPKCGGGPLKIAHKRKAAKVGWRVQYQCLQCGGYSTPRASEKSQVQFTN